MTDTFVNFTLVVLAFLIGLSGVLTNTIKKTLPPKSARKRRGRRGRKQDRRSAKSPKKETWQLTAKGKMVVSLLTLILAFSLVKEYRAQSAGADFSRTIMNLQSKLSRAEIGRNALDEKLSDANEQLEISLDLIEDLRGQVDSQTAKGIELALSKPLSLSMQHTMLPVRLRRSEKGKIVKFFGFDCKIFATLESIVELPAPTGHTYREFTTVGAQLLEGDVKEYRLSWTDGAVQYLLEKGSYKKLLFEEEAVTVMLTAETGDPCSGRYVVLPQI